MMMMKKKAFTVCLLACCSLLLSAQDPQVETFKWENKVSDYTGKSIPVAESTTVYPEKQMMFMNASDPQLRETPAYRSVSHHDFQAGLVALKPLGGQQCIVGSVKRTYNETVKELRRRADGETPDQERRPVVVVRGKNSRRTGSKALDRFCRGRRLLFVRDSATDELPEPWIRFPPLLCIWGPVDIFFPIDTTFIRDVYVSPEVRRWSGPFAPFP
ncbi:uncharacterized protein LOC143274943 [Babylonia areolata]|uniref:uncharacterized protein LOC143274943 n=1 Tax=Babylonia areolata TaxID=304850 RepID=UPI003FD57ED1